MTKEEKIIKNRLNAYKRISAEVEKKEAEYNDVFLSALPSGITYDRDNVQTSPRNDQVIDTAEELAEIKAELMELYSMRLKAYKNVNTLIFRLKNEKYRAVLGLKYIQGVETYRDIAVATGTTAENARKRHERAVKCLSVTL